MYKYKPTMNLRSVVTVALMVATAELALAAAAGVLAPRVAVTILIRRAAVYLVLGAPRKIVVAARRIRVCFVVHGCMCIHMHARNGLKCIRLC
jgi:hypothetical protein